MGITSKNIGFFLFGYNIKECGIFDLGITLKNVVNDFFFLFFQFIILDAIIFLLFLLNEKFCPLISEHPFVLICFDSEHPWMDRMYLYWNVLGIFCLREFVVWFSCNRSSCPSFMFFCTKPETEHKKKISCGHFNEKLLVWFWDAQKWICCFLYQWD